MTDEPKDKPSIKLSAWELLALPTFEYNRASITSAALSEALSDVPSDVIIKSRIKYGSRMSACKGFLQEYSKSTTIHGIRYIFEVHRPIYEKLYWLVVTCISVYFSMSLIWDIYLKWQDTPVILGFDETLVPVHKIPFPTITICPEIKMDSNVFDFTKISKKIWRDFQGNRTFDDIDANDLARMAAAMHICDADVVKKFKPLLIQFQQNLDISGLLADVSISKNESAPFCRWSGRHYFCHMIMDMVATDEGICYQFNGLRPKDIYRDERFISYVDPDVVDFNNYFDKSKPPFNNVTGSWSPDKGYVGQGQNACPQRTAFSSVRNAFFAFLQGFEHNHDYDCHSSFKIQGYKVFLNSPESVPLTTAGYVQVPYGIEVMVGVSPNYMISSEYLQEISIEKRQCYFNDDRQLRFFRYYSHNNCQTECLANFTISKCGCAKFWMPKPLGVRVCGLADIACYTKAQVELSVLLQKQTMQQTVDVNAKIMCNCIPACSSLGYNLEISRGRYDVNNTLNAMREKHDHKDFLASRLSVYFRERQFTAIKRIVIYGIPTLISNCGGIFGLFMGISGLSFIELVYFFTLRIWNSCRQRQKAKQQLPAL